MAREVRGGRPCRWPCLHAPIRIENCIAHREGVRDLSAGDDRFREMFYEEARELLIALEEGLVELERRQGDRAHLDRTFRAAHSIKGAAGMVGLAAIAEFTHGIEAVLDRIRAAKLSVDSDI